MTAPAQQEAGARPEAWARVEAALRAASQIADPSHPLGELARARLVATSGLSPEGVSLALTRHLETRASDEEMASLLAACAPAPRCHVVLAANVCTAPLRAIACALATAPEVVVRPSRRDPVLADLLVRALQDDRSFRGSIAIAEQVTPALGEALHVYGRDETIAEIAAGMDEGVRLWGHGTGLGLAVVEQGVALDEAAAAFAEDLVPFDGRGCLSPRLVMVHGDAGRARAFAGAAQAALTREGEAVPRGPLRPEDAAALRRYRDTMIAIGEAYEGPHHLIGFDPEPESLALGPALRCGLVIPARRIPADVERLAPRIAAVGRAGAGALAEAVAALVPKARRSALGRMQRPPLDGPVARRAR